MQAARTPHSSGAGRVHALFVPLAVGSLLVAALLLRLYFWRHTQRTWDDAWVAILHVENFWAGLGLTLVQPGGAPLQGFSSPLGVLVPWLAGLADGVAAHALAWQKGAAAAASVAVVGLAWRLMQRVEVEPGLRLGWVVFALGYLAFEYHQVLWGMAGMETSVVTLVLFFNFHAYAVRSPRLIAVAMALALYATPEFLLLDLLGLAFCLTLLRREVSRIVAIAFLLYLPWLVFTSLYYGSPVPHPFWARLYGLGWEWGGLPRFLAFLTPLGPSFAGHGAGYWRMDGGFTATLVLGLFIVGAYQVLAQRLAVLFMPVGFVVAYWLYGLFAVGGLTHAQLAPLSAATVLIAGHGLICVFPRPTAALVAAGAYAAVLAAVLPGHFSAERDIQRHIEAPVRQQMGLYLGQAMGPGDAAGMESLGHAAYHSRRTILDYPGLGSRQVVDHLRKNPRAGLCGVMDALRPLYLALRPAECNGWAFLAQGYALEREFKAARQADGIAGSEGNANRHFLVYRRKPPAPPAAPPVPAESPNAPFV